ncbi:FeoB-associated Cys-rich membrane protein [Blautia sp. An249]|uniref:FeoB-associated Cys-rich membrane protein n=1 Tax=Blautia sp. An249 TaxID=1965603 RepID=UPI0011231E50|nr:FeoB-associated Cys-rich membrane protein [Blautia sp. An249]
MIANIIILGLIFLYCTCLIFRQIKNRKNPGAGCCGCSGCSSCKGGCAGCGEEKLP